MPVSDRRRVSAIQWATLALMVVQLIAYVFQAGQIVERVTDIGSRLVRIERWLDEHTRTADPKP